MTLFQMKEVGQDTWCVLPDLCVDVRGIYFVIGLYLGTRVFMMSQPMR